MSTISDSHLGFDKPANPIGEVRALLAKPLLFDDADRNSGESRLGMRDAPGERALNDERQLYCGRDGRGSEGTDWYSFLMTRKIIRSAGIKSAGNKSRRPPILSDEPIPAHGRQS
jgi:hypothetical protein